MNAEAERVTAQANSIRVSSWCAKVTPDNVPRIDEIYGEYRAFEQEMRDAVDAECPGRVNAAYMVSTYRAAEMSPPPSSARPSRTTPRSPARER